jgi:dihydrolipoamide dehydrogenase
MDGTMEQTYDLVVIGAGPGGYVAAIRAGQLGLRTALVEKDARLGGTCLHRGCIPTKALLESATVYDRSRRAGTWGIRVGEVAVDWPAVQKRKTRVVRKNAAGIDYLMKKHRVTVLQGRGRLAGEGRVQVQPPDGDPLELQTRHVLLATGSVPMPLRGFEPDGERVLTSDHLLEVDHVPASLVVLGAGAVGVEFASIFQRLGSEVTLVEMLPRVLPIEDHDVSAELARILGGQGITIRTGTRATGVERSADGVRVTLATTEAPGVEETLEAELLLVAVGRAPAGQDLGLETVGLQLDTRGRLPVDPYQRTTAPGVYAIGDLVPGAMLAHLASAEGILAVDHLAGRAVTPIDHDLVPSCTYCEPEVASVGLSEAEARNRGREVTAARFPFAAVGKARILDAEEGFVKLVLDREHGELLGVHIIGPHATDLLGEACVALELECTGEYLAHVIHPHPTLCEALMEAAHAVVGEPIHI